MDMPATPQEELLDESNNNNSSPIFDSFRPLECRLCGRFTALDNDLNLHLTVCDDCKFLLAEDIGTPAPNSNRTRFSRRSTSTSSSFYASTSASTDNHFSHIINAPTHHQDVLDDDADSNLRLLHPNSATRSHRRIVSETESDDVSNSDLYYGESGSNFSYGPNYHADSDALSFSIYEGDSDASVGGRTFFNADIVQSVDRSDLGSTDSDIDPMHAGDVQWESDDDDEMEEGDWEEEEVDNDENAFESLEDSGFFSRNGSDSPESVGIIRWRISGVNLQVPRIRIGMDNFEPSEASYVGDPRNYLNARGFDDFLEHIAETDGSRRGAPPASTSFVKNMPVVIICEEHQKPEGLACAICKDVLTIGTQVNELPCLHRYHPVCILPWLRERNTCPLCRYELPAENNTNHEHDRRRMVLTEIEHRDDDSSSSSMTETDSSEIDELRGALEDVGPTSGLSRGRGRWLLSAAAPIVSLVGIVFLLWLGNPLVGGQRQAGDFNLHCGPANVIQTSGSCPRNERGRRWWWF